MKISEPFACPSLQTILPVILSGGRVVGFLPIAKHLFTLPTEEVLTVDGPVMAVSVTLPEGTADRLVSQYAAIYYPPEQEAAQPWTGFSSFISANECGYFNDYTIAAGGIIHRFNRGTLINALITGMDDERGAAAPQQPTAPTPPVGSQELPIALSATVNTGVLNNLSFFDFNWLSVLLSKKQIPGLDTWVSPSITVESSPMPKFKATVVQGGAPISGCLFDTVRIIKMGAPVVGDYLVTFSVRDGAASVPAVYFATLNIKVTQ